MSEVLTSASIQNQSTLAPQARQVHKGKNKKSLTDSIFVEKKSGRQILFADSNLNLIKNN